MTAVNVLDITIANNPSAFLDPFSFEITFECFSALKEGERRRARCADASAAGGFCDDSKRGGCGDGRRGLRMRRRSQRRRHRDRALCAHICVVVGAAGRGGGACYRGLARGICLASVCRASHRRRYDCCRPRVEGCICRLWRRRAARPGAAVRARGAGARRRQQVRSRGARAFKSRVAVSHGADPCDGRCHRRVPACPSMHGAVVSRRAVALCAVERGVASDTTAV